MRYGLALLLLVALLVIVELALSPGFSEIPRKVEAKESAVTPLSSVENGEPSIDRGKPAPYTANDYTGAGQYIYVQPPLMRAMYVFVGIAVYGLALFSFYLAKKRRTAYHMSLVARLLPVWYLSLSIFLAVYLGLVAIPLLAIAAWRMYVIFRSWQAVRRVLE